MNSANESFMNNRIIVDISNFIFVSDDPKTVDAIFLPGGSHPEQPEYAAKPYDGPRCIASINRLLLDASYPELYEGNPYDWIFLYASPDAYPLDAFRSFMREAYLNKMAPENALH